MRVSLCLFPRPWAFASRLRGFFLTTLEALCCQGKPPSPPMTLLVARSSHWFPFISLFPPFLLLPPPSRACLTFFFRIPLPAPLPLHSANSFPSLPLDRLLYLRKTKKLLLVHPPLHSLRLLLPDFLFTFPVRLLLFPNGLPTSDFRVSSKNLLSLSFLRARQKIVRFSYVFYRYRRKRSIPLSRG